MRVITESEGVRVTFDAGTYEVKLPDEPDGDHTYIDNDVPLEALLAIVADRLREHDDGPAHESIAKANVEIAIRHMRAAARWPAPQKQGRG